MIQNEGAIRVLVATLAAAYPRETIREATLKLYVRKLCDLSPPALAQAVDECILTSRFFPTVAEIRDRVAVARVCAPTPEEAWGEVMAAVSRWGRYRDPQWSHALVGQAADCMGWASICDCDEDGIGTLRAHYLRAYSGIRDRHQREVQIEGALPSMPERKRIAGGDPVSVGSALGQVMRRLAAGGNE